MSRRTTGAVLLFISASLYSTRYLAAAIMGSSLTHWNADLFGALLQYVGRELEVWSLIALIGGLVYLVWAEFDPK